MARPTETVTTITVRNLPIEEDVFRAGQCIAYTTGNSVHAVWIVFNE
jgi:hypothetical protein